MKILSVPKGSQQSLRGQVVLVPSNVQLTASSLPRNTSDAQIIALNLKRSLSDKSIFCQHYIRPQRVNDAIVCLKRINDHYLDISTNGNWESTSQFENAELWKSAAYKTSVRTPSSPEIVSEPESSDNNQNPNTVLETGDTEEITDSDDELEKDAPKHIVEDINYERSLNSVICMYPEHGPSIRSDKVLNLAPAEGQIPTSAFYQKDWETLAFPTIFPDGLNTFDTERTVKISPKKYVNARLLSSDSRFAEYPEYTFQCLHWIETVSINESILMYMKKSRQGDASVGDLLDPEKFLLMFKEEEIFASFKRV